jgi:hypothetical protein
VKAPPVLGLVLELTHTTADALEAALELRAHDLRLLDQRRADLVFELQLEIQQSPVLTDPERASLTHALEDLRSLELRLVRISRVVTHALRPLDGPPTPALYAPTGTLRG